MTHGKLCHFCLNFSRAQGWNVTWIIRCCALTERIMYAQKKTMLIDILLEFPFTCVFIQHLTQSDKNWKLGRKKRVKRSLYLELLTWHEPLMNVFDYMISKATSVRLNEAYMRGGTVCYRNSMNSCVSLILGIFNWRRKKIFVYTFSVRIGHFYLCVLERHNKFSYIDICLQTGDSTKWLDNSTAGFCIPLSN